jgi:hypothetical protein
MGEKQKSNDFLGCRGIKISTISIPCHNFMYTITYPNGNNNTDGANAQINIKKMNQITFQMCKLVWYRLSSAKTVVM